MKTESQETQLTPIRPNQSQETQSLRNVIHKGHASVTQSPLKGSASRHYSIEELSLNMNFGRDKSHTNHSTW